MDLSNENVIHVKKNGIEYLQFKKLLEYEDDISHAYSLGIDRNFRTAKANKEKLDKDIYDKTIEDYKHLSKQIGLDYINIVKSNQAHTNEVKIVKSKIKKDEPDFNLEEYTKTDGLITNKRNIGLSTTNADCILLLFYDPIKKIIANTHSGWRGTLQRISVKTVEKMRKEYGSNPEDIICCICPSIRKCHFEVDKDVKDMFEEEFQDLGKENLENIIEEKIKDKKWNIDTVLINQICSVCNKDLIHSYRAEKEGYGLNTALIYLK